MIKKFILFYIATRTITLALTGVHVFGRMRFPDIVGGLFPILILFFYIKSQDRVSNKSKLLYSLLIVWTLFSSLLGVVTYDSKLYFVSKQWLRLLNGYVVFLYFPLVFKTEDDIKQLVNAFLIGTIFPALQFLLILGGWGARLGLEIESIGGGNNEAMMFEGMYGNYGVFGFNALLGLLALTYKTGYFSAYRSKSKAFFLLGAFFVCAAPPQFTGLFFISIGVHPCALYIVPLWCSVS